MSRGPADAASGVIAARQRVRSEGSEEHARALHRHLQGTWSATPSTAVGQETAIVTGSGERGGIGKLVAVAVRIYRERPNSIDTHAQMYPFKFNNKYNCRILFTLSKDTARELTPV